MNIEIKIHELIEMLNENNKNPYYFLNTDNIDGLIIISVRNKANDFLFNILDSEGKTPSNMSVNWRIIQHITHDLIEYNNLNKNKMPKLSKTKAFSVSSEIIEVDFQGQICEVANLLKSGILNQTIVLVSHNDKWHEINVLNLGGDDSNLQAFKNFVETMKSSLVDLGITTETIKKTSTVLTHDDFLMLSEKYPVADYIQISLLNDYNVKSGGKSSIDTLSDDLKVITRDGITVDRYIFRRENDKIELLKKSKNMKTENVQELEILPSGEMIIPVEKIEVPVNNIEVHEAAVLVPIQQAKISNLPENVSFEPSIMPTTAPAKKPISLQVFETLTPERISELQGLNERQNEIVKQNPVITITDKASYELAKKTAAILLKASTAIDGSAGIEATATKYLNTFKNMLKTALGPIAKLTRDPYDKQKEIISSWENSELLKQQALEREKLQRIKLRTDELFAVPFTFNGSIYSIGTVYCTPSQVETATDEDFLIIVNNGKAIKQALDAEALVQSAKDQRIAELEAKLAKLEMLENMSNTDQEAVSPAISVVNNPIPANNTLVNPVPENSILGQAEQKTASAYTLPAQDNILLNRLDLENVDHLEKPAYIKCRGYYVRGLKDVGGLIIDILNNPDVTIKKSVKLAELAEILKKSE